MNNNNNRLINELLQNLGNRIINHLYFLRNYYFIIFNILFFKYESKKK